MKQFRTGVSRAAPVEQASRSLCQRVSLPRIGEREIVGRIEMIGLLAPRSHRLAKAKVERHEAAANMRKGAVENATSRLVTVEAERQQAADHPPALRAAFDDGQIVGSVHRIGGSRIVLVGIAQEGAEITRGGKSEAAHGRILGAVDQFVKMSRFEAVAIAEMPLVRRQSPVLPASSKAPSRVRNRLARILLARPDGQRRQKPVRERRGIVEVRSRIAVVAVDWIVLDLLAEADRHACRRNRRDDLGAHETGDRRAVVIVRHDRRHTDAVQARTHVHFPPEPHHRVAGPHEPAVAGGRQRIPIRDAARNACVEGAGRKLVAAVVDFEEQDSIPAGHVGRLQEFDIGHIFDHAPRIARGEIDVLNPGVSGIGGIELPRGSAGQTLISASVAEGLAAEGGLCFGDLDMRDPRVRRRPS